MHIIRNISLITYRKLYVLIAGVLATYLLLLYYDVYPAYAAVNELFVPLAAVQVYIKYKEDFLAPSYWHLPTTYLLGLGILSSVIGDTCFNVIADGVFVPGVVCFFITHVAYTIIMFEMTGRNINSNYFVLFVLVVCVLIIALLCIYLWSALQGMRFLISIYFISLLAMCFFAANTSFCKNVHPDRAILLMCGSFCFLISDTLFGVTTLSLGETFASGMLVNFFYVLAQVLLIRGCIWQPSRG